MILSVTLARKGPLALIALLLLVVLLLLRLICHCA